MLDSCDRGTVIGRRDYAILLLLARLGLRAGEVVALTLDDFNWSEGIVTVPGKGKRREPLPLPRDAGEGLTDYLRAGRPACPTRRLFVRMHAPHRGFRSSAAVCDIVRRALTRAGINSPFKGAHLLRHSLATSMLRNGASLEDIGQVLRHRHPETTQIYAKGRSGCAARSRASLARRCGMTDLQQLLGEYLATRRALGVGLRLAGSLLQRFVAFAAQTEAAFITTELALQWATEPRGAQPAQWATRLGIVRRFARFAHAADPRHEVPPPRLLSHRYRRSQPYLYTDGEFADLLRAAQGLSGTTGLRPCTYATLLALLAVTGMRSSEPLRLNRDDVDLARGVLTVRKSKFGKSRYIPVHESTRQALINYAARRDRLCRHPSSPSFFLSEPGARVTVWALRWTFVKLSRQVGLRGPSDSRGPRLHDLRHRFAVETLLRWYRDGIDVERHLPRLTTYLGHAHVSDTYWYLTVTPELMQLAARRLDRAGRRPLT